MTNEDGETSMIGAITVDTASIETATVAINTLTISGKQVTLDVFRQLKDAALINHEGSLAGPPWGMVNYHQKSCDKLEKHVHVVWQLGDQLRQDTVQPPRWEPYWSDVCDALVFAAGTVEPPSRHVGGRPSAAPATEPSATPSVSLEVAEVWPQKPPQAGHHAAPGASAAPLPHPEQPTRYIWSWPEFGDKSYRDGSISRSTASNAAAICTPAYLGRPRTGG